LADAATLSFHLPANGFVFLIAKAILLGPEARAFAIWKAEPLAIAVLGANTAENFAFLENTLIRILAAESAQLFLGAAIALAVPLHAQQLGTFVAQPGHLGPWTDHSESAADKINDP
jgi:hypothetical protein